MCKYLDRFETRTSGRSPPRGTFADDHYHRVQVNIAAESGEMGILAQHVPSIEQLKPGLVEIIEESGGNKQFFRALRLDNL